MTKSLQYLFFASLVLCFGYASAQRVNINLNNAPFQKLVDNVEQATPFRFYFHQQRIDSVYVTATGEYDVRELLTEALQGSELSFAIDLNKNIYITKGRSILTSLPAGVIPKRNIAGGDENFDASSFEKKNKKQAEEASVVYVLGAKSAGLKGNATVTGFVRDASTGEALPGVAVFQPDPLVGSSTDALGQYSITLPKGKRVLSIQSVGMKVVQRTIMLYGDGKLDIELEEEITALKDVVVSSEQEISVTGLQMGREKLDIRTMRQMPLALGETDVLKVMLTLPGVQSVGEGASGLNVRGGASNQNLILFNGATVYNPSHLFGFFSTFNPDVLKGIELYKSGLEANMGGRLSSVLDITSREGNLKKLNVTGGISPITGRITVEGPLAKGKTSFLLAGRSTYSDWILKRLESGQFNKSTASFYDLNLNVGHKLNDNNHIVLSAYMSHDEFKLNTDTLYSYSDRNASLKWSHRFSPKLFSDLTATASQYQFAMQSTANPVYGFKLEYKIRQYQAKADVKYVLNDKNTIHAGWSSILYQLKPGDYLPLGAASIENPDKQESERGLENAVYAGNQFEVNKKLSLYLGLRYSFYSYLGAKTVYQYQSGFPVELSTLIDTTQYGKGAIKTYHGLEPRFTARYMVSGNSSIKFSFGRTRQYIQMLSNNTAIAPTDVWKLSDTYIQPQVADQISAGWFKNWNGGVYEFSTEVYYKNISRATDFQNGAILLRNHHLETDVLNAKGKAYGAEFMIKKSAGRLNGWVSYTYSRSFMLATSPYEIEKVNAGKYYPSNFDKPHAVNVISNYKFNRRINISLNMTYSTGRPITLPLAKYGWDGSSRLDYSERNAYRIPDYFRSDISINLEGNHKVRKFAHSSWTFAVYNLTGRRNAYSVFFRTENNQIKGYKLSVFGQAIPTLTYNFKI
jgi:CarboxypepD_reg-like domain/TonB-dependent Receptor Plug Domain